MTTDLFNCKTVVVDHSGNVKSNAGIFLFVSHANHDINFNAECIGGVLDTSNALISSDPTTFSDPQKAWIWERPGSLYYLMRGSVGMMPVSVPLYLEGIQDNQLPRKTIIRPQLLPDAKEGMEILRFILPRKEMIPYMFSGNITVLYDGEVQSIIDDLTYIRTLYIEASKNASITVSKNKITIL